MDYAALKAEITDDPLGRGYAGMTDHAIASDLNTVYRNQNRTSLTGSEVINAVTAVEWTALTDTQKQTVWDIVHLGTINPFGVEATLLIEVFGVGSATIAALAEARIIQVSRAAELGLGIVKTGYVQQVRG